MLDSFEKESKLGERRAARQRQMRLMEEAASGLPTSSPSQTNQSSSSEILGPPTVADMKNHGMFSIDDTDDEDAGPPSMFSNTSTTDGVNLHASSLLWNSKTGKDLSLDAEKLGFITGSDGSGPPPTNDASGGNAGRSVTWSSTRKKKAVNHDHDESRELILMASRRLSMEDTPQAGNRGRNSNARNSSNFQIDEEQGGDDFQQHRSRPYIKLPPCCMIHRRAISATLIIVTLFIILTAVMEPIRKNSKSSSNSEGAALPPWYNYEPLRPPPQSDYDTLTANDQEKYARIKDRILEHGISHASSLEETYSPQYKALTWITRDDPRQLDLPSRDDEAVGMTGPNIDEEHQLFERYALAVLWFQTNDLTIVRESMTSRNYVEDVFDVPFDPLTLTREQIAWNSNGNWMTEKGYCSWHGVTCHPKELP